MPVILPQSSVKPALWMCDPGIVAYNCARMGLPMPILPVPVWERAGDKVYDYSGNNQHGDIGSTISWSGEGLNIPGDDASVINFGVNSALNNLPEFTFFCRVKPDILAEYLEVVWIASYHYFDFKTSSIRAKRYFSDGEAYSNSDTGYLSANTTYNVAVTLKNGTLRIYISGQEVTYSEQVSKSGTIYDYSGENLQIGRTDNASFSGAFYSFIVFDTALTLSQYQTLNNNPYGMFEKIRSPAIWSVPGGPTYTLTAEAGSFSLVGQTTDLLLNRLLEANAGAFTLSGQDANLLLGRLLNAESGAFSLTGQSVNLLLNRLLSVESGSFTLSGTNVNLLLGRVLGTTAGSFTLTGTDVDLIYSGSGPTYTLTAEPGSFTLTGTNANLLVNRILAADSGLFSLSGQDVTLLLNRLLVAGSGSFTLSGQDVTLLANRILNTEIGDFTLIGQDAGLFLSRLLSAESGQFTLAGQDITLLANRKLNAEAGAFDLTGQDVTLTWSGETLAVGKLTITFTPRKPGHIFTPRKPGHIFTPRKPGIVLS